MATNLGTRPSQERFLPDLRAFKSQVSKALESGHDLQTKESVTLLVRKLPLLENGKISSSLQNLSHDEAEEALHLFSEIGKDFLWLRLQTGLKEPPRQKILLSVDYLVPLKLLALAEAVCKTHPHVLSLPPSASLTTQFDRQELHGDHFPHPVYASGWDEEARQLSLFWKEASGTSFFGLDEFPATESHISRHLWEDSNQKKEDARIWDQKIKWSDLDWAVDFVQSPQIQVKIAGRRDLKAQSLVGQALTLLSEGRQSGILPGAFFDLRDLAYVANANALTEWSYDPEPPQRSLGIVQPSPQVEEKGRWGLPPLRLFGTDWSRTNAHRPYWRDGAPDHYISSNLLQAAQPKPGPIEKELYVASWGKEVDELIQRTPPLWKPYMGKEKFQGPLREYRERLALPAIRELQVFETLNFYQDRIQLLQETDAQVEFERLMFEPGLLMDRLLSGPDEGGAFARQLALFCKRGYSSFLHLGNRSAAAFMLEMNRRFLDQVATAQSIRPRSIPEAVAKEFLGRVPK